MSEYRVVGMGADRRLAEGETVVVVAGVQGPPGSVAGLDEINVKAAEHVAATDPHPQYETSAEAAAKVAAHTGLATAAHAATAIANTPAGSIAATTVQAAINELNAEKAAASHSHAQSDVTGLATSLSAKQETSGKNQASGYAGLSASTKLAVAQMGTGTPGSTNYLRGDGAWQVPAASEITNTPTAPVTESTVQAAIDQLARLSPRNLQTFIADVTNSSSAAQSLFWYEVPAGTLSVNGQAISARYAGTLNANVNAKSVAIHVSSGSAVMVSGGLSNLDWAVDLLVVRVSSTVVRVVARGGWNGVGSAYIDYFEVTGLNLATTAFAIDLRGTGAAAGDITARMGIITLGT